MKHEVYHLFLTCSLDTTRKFFPVRLALLKKDWEILQKYRNPGNHDNSLCGLVILLGKGTHNVYWHVNQDRKMKRRDRVRDDQGCPSSSLPQSSQRARCGRRRYRKLQINIPRRGDENAHHHEHDPEHSNISFGISREVRASTQARASH